MAIAPEKLAWMAAILDMKAHVWTKINSQRATPQFVLSVQSTNTGVIRELGRLTGTNPEYVREQKPKEWMRRGCTEHCPEAHIHAETGDILPSGAKWTLTGTAAAIVLDSVIPYMITDQGLAEMRDIMFGQMVLTGQGVGNVRKAVDRLAGLGWPIPDQILAKIAPPKEKAS